MKLLAVFSIVFSVAYGYVPVLDGRIVGGHEVNIENYPYQVSVRVFDQHICGGTIIDVDTILTAAHCVHGMEDYKYSIRVGATKHKQGKRIIVSQIKKNSDYNPHKLDNDMAILKLSTPLTFDSSIQPIKLQLEGEEVDVNTIAWVSGWGVTKEGAHVVPESLRAVDVSIISDNDCNRKYAHMQITPRMICAQTLKHDSCQGDSGGPLVANGRLIGVVSWGYGCARPEYPGVYAKVSNMYSWIMANK